MKIPHLDTESIQGYKVLISTCSIPDNCLQSKSVGSKGRLKSILRLETVFAHLGGVSVLHKNVSQIIAIIDFFKQRNYQKNLVSKEENHMHNFKPNKFLNLDKFGIGNYISDCRSAPFAGLHIDLIICIIYVSQRTHFKLMIDFRLECLQARGWGLRETCCK